MGVKTRITTEFDDRLRLPNKLIMDLQEQV